MLCNSGEVIILRFTIYMQSSHCIRSISSLLFDPFPSMSFFSSVLLCFSSETAIFFFPSHSRQHTGVKRYHEEWRDQATFVKLIINFTYMCPHSFELKTFCNFGIVWVTQRTFFHFQRYLNYMKLEMSFSFVWI